MALNNIVIYYQNCRGIRTKLHTLYMNILSCSYDVIVLTETWLIPSIQDSEFIDDRYIVFRFDRDRLATKKREGGGVLVAVLRELRPTKIMTHFIHSEVEQIAIQLPSSRQNSHHIISATYIPPRTHEDIYLQYFDMLQDLANDTSCDSYFFLGDFNIPDIDWLDQGGDAIAQVSSSIGRGLLNLMGLVNGTQYNATKNKLGRILDLLISNVDCQTISCNTLLDPDSHHPPFSAITSLGMLFAPMKCHSVQRYNFHKADMDGMELELGKINWVNALSHLSSEEAVDTFYETVYGIIRLHVPLTRIKNANYPVWFSPSLIRILKKKERAWVRWKIYNNLSDYLTFSNYRNLFHNQCARCYRNYIESVENNIPKNVKYFWSFISARKCKAKLPSSMFFRNVTSDDPTNICNLFSNYFCSVYEPSSFNPNTWQPPTACLENASSVSDIFLTEDVISMSLKSLDPSKGAGPDGLPPSFFIKLYKSLCTPLYIIFNKCIREGVFPAVWKKAFITPVYKSGDKSNVENYRPISILSTLSKVFERLVHGSLYPHIHQHIILEQHGFVKRRSTTTNLMVFTNYLFEHMDQRIQVDAVYTDFQKAFDKVDHKILMDKIAFNGIRGNLLRWFMSYIFNRTQKVVVNGYESDVVTVTSGVPQGSILGPLLFILFINDIKQCFINSRFLMYADDIKIYTPCKTIEDCLLLQDDLNRLHTYCTVNKLFLSLPKCHAISFTKNKNKINHIYSISDVPLKTVLSVRDLGVILDSCLHFDVHHNAIINKAFQMFGFVMRSSRDFVRPSTFLLLYKTLIRSQLEYASPIWNPLYEKYISGLEMVQKKFLRSMNYKCYHSKTPYTQLLEKYNILSLQHRRMLLSVMMLHGLCNNRFDCTDLTNKLCYTVPRTVIRREVRASHLFYIESCKTNAGVRVPLRRIADIYNSHFTQLDIFNLANNQFKIKAVKLLSEIVIRG